MRYFADLHIHSRFSRATSRDLDLEHLSEWAQRKGIAIAGTGDFTHPGWRAELRDKLVPAEPGLFRLRDDVEREVAARVPPACRGPVRFLLQVEISTIYKKGDRTRKVHHLVYVPDFDAAERLCQSLERIGNLKSDGRPILGLDSRDLLELTLESGPDSFLIPAHIWTPWFAALGSRSGFDAIDECYGDLAPEIFALETGLSSDPPMNWRLSALDRFRLVSSSDAHSPSKLGREASVFDTEPSYFSLRDALRTGEGYVGTVEFFPEEGKYHLDGHRKCGVRLSPEETRELGGRCPACGGAVTVGVMHRVVELADRETAAPPRTAGEVTSLLALPQILSELLKTGAASKRVKRTYDELVARVGPELFLLQSAPLDEIEKRSSSLVAEALRRLREGRVQAEAGYDGEYGTIRLFDDSELKDRTKGAALFDVGAPAAPLPRPTGAASGAAALAPVGESPKRPETGSERPPSVEIEAVELDEDQRRVVEHEGGAIVVIAGPGSGKTRALTHRIAHLVEARGVEPERCLAITFTRRAANEMKERLERLLGERAARVPIHTFHSLGLSILREFGAAAGVHRGFRVAGPADQLAAVATCARGSGREARRLLSRVSLHRRGGANDAATEKLAEAYRRELETRGLLDFDDLIERASGALEDERVRAAIRGRYDHVLVDEVQDTDPAQFRMLRLLAPPGSNLCAIGDPDQAIYSFRGADPRFLERLLEEDPAATCVRLSRNYRSAGAIRRLAGRVFGREIDPAGADEPKVVEHEARSEKGEAEFCVHAIERLLGGHSFFSIDSGRTAGSAHEGAIGFGDIAILFRTAEQGDVFAEALQRSGMPYQRADDGPLLEQPRVRDLLDALERREERRRGDAAPGEDGSLAAVLERAARSLGGDGDPELRRAVEQIQPFATRAPDLESLRADVALARACDPIDPRAERIALLTLHAAKGLEFDVVFVTGCEDGLLPLSFGPPPSPEEIAEERRLFYVGVTRARRRLFLTRAHRRTLRGRRKEHRPSPFLEDLRELLVRDDREHAAPRPAARQLELF